VDLARCGHACERDTQRCYLIYGTEYLVQNTLNVSFKRLLVAEIVPARICRFPSLSGNRPPPAAIGSLSRNDERQGESVGPNYSNRWGPRVRWAPYGDCICYCLGEDHWGCGVMFRVGMPPAYQCFSPGQVDSVAFLSRSRWEEKRRVGEGAGTWDCE
jgi:hypothetical protein